MNENNCSDLFLNFDEFIHDPHPNVVRFCANNFTEEEYEQSCISNTKEELEKLIYFIKENPSEYFKILEKHTNEIKKNAGFFSYMKSVIFNTILGEKQEVGSENCSNLSDAYEKLDKLINSMHVVHQYNTESKVNKLKRKSSDDSITNYNSNVLSLQIKPRIKKNLLDCSTISSDEFIDLKSKNMNENNKMNCSGYDIYNNKFHFSNYNDTENLLHSNLENYNFGDTGNSIPHKTIKSLLSSPSSLRRPSLFSFKLSKNKESIKKSKINSDNDQLGSSILINDIRINFDTKMNVKFKKIYNNKNDNKNDNKNVNNNILNLSYLSDVSDGFPTCDISNYEKATNIYFDNNNIDNNKFKNNRKISCTNFSLDRKNKNLDSNPDDLKNTNKFTNELTNKNSNDWAVEGKIVEISTNKQIDKIIDSVKDIKNYKESNNTSKLVRDMEVFCNNKENNCPIVSPEKDFKITKTPPLPPPISPYFISFLKLKMCNGRLIKVEDNIDCEIEEQKQDKDECENLDDKASLGLLKIDKTCNVLTDIIERDLKKNLKKTDIPRSPGGTPLVNPSRLTPVREMFPSSLAHNRHMNYIQKMEDEDLMGQAFKRLLKRKFATVESPYQSDQSINQTNDIWTP